MRLDLAIAQALTALFGAVQPAVDAVLRAPAWTSQAALGFAALLLALGRHGLRPLCGALLAAFSVALALGPLRAHLGAQSPVPGLAALAGGGAAFFVGVSLPGWTLAALCAAVAAEAFAAAAQRVGLPEVVMAAPAAALAFFIALANARTASVVLPPLTASLLTALGAVRLLPDLRGRYPELAQAPYLLLAAGVLFLVLLPLALEREARAVRRAASRAARRELERLSADKAQRQAKFARYTGQS